jgi:hypothetical protein
MVEHWWSRGRIDLENFNFAIDKVKRGSVDDLSHIMHNMPFVVHINQHALRSWTIIPQPVTALTCLEFAPLCGI